MYKTRQRTEFGDFQTPPALADDVCRLLKKAGVEPASVVEPTCGHGSLLIAALAQFPSVQSAVGLEINPEHLNYLRRRLAAAPFGEKATLIDGDFFTFDWDEYLLGLPDPILVIGNPPWVTNSALATLASENLPAKSNFQDRSGYDAITGKSNFDIAEWMLLRVMEWLRNRRGIMAMLCKAAVARKLLHHGWKNDLSIGKATLHRIDAARHFDAAVDACLFTCQFTSGNRSDYANVFPHPEARDPDATLAWRDGQMVSDAVGYDRLSHLAASKATGPYLWRSGVKHDCSKVMELGGEPGRWVNKLGEIVDIEATYLFPMLKSSEVANCRTSPNQVMLVTQTTTGSQTEEIRHVAPQTWRYLLSHADLLDNRKSKIYRNRPRFAVFGIGDYTFAPFKVAISGFYKRLEFQVISSDDGKPVVFDDTVNFVACDSHREADFVASLLNSHESQAFYSSLVFWDAKRPITVDLLGRLDLRKLASQLGCEAQFDDFTNRRTRVAGQKNLF